MGGSGGGDGDGGDGSGGSSSTSNNFEQSSHRKPPSAGFRYVRRKTPQVGTLVYTNLDKEDNGAEPRATESMWARGKGFSH